MVSSSNRPELTYNFPPVTDQDGSDFMLEFYREGIDRVQAAMDDGYDRELVRSLYGGEDPIDIYYASVNKRDGWPPILRLPKVETLVNEDESDLVMDDGARRVPFAVVASHPGPDAQKLSLFGSGVGAAGYLLVTNEPKHVEALRAALFAGVKMQEPEGLAELLYFGRGDKRKHQNGAVTWLPTEGQEANIDLSEWATHTGIVIENFGYVLRTNPTLAAQALELSDWAADEPERCSIVLTMGLNDFVEAMAHQPFQGYFRQFHKLLSGTTQVQWANEMVGAVTSGASQTEWIVELLTHTTLRQVLSFDRNTGGVEPYWLL